MNIGTYVIIGVVVFVIIVALLYPTPFWKKKDTYPKPSPGGGSTGPDIVDGPDQAPQK